MDHRKADLLNLASKFQDESLDPQEMARLNSLLQTDEARSDFVDLAHVHFCLKKDAVSDDCKQLANSIGAVHRSIIPANPPRPIQFSSALTANARAATRRRAAYKSPRIIWGSLAGVVVLGIATLAIVRPGVVRQIVASNAIQPESLHSGQQPPTTSVAKDEQNIPSKAAVNFVARIVAATSEVNWHTEGAPSDVLMRLSSGERITVDAGLLKVEFADGAVIILSGPSELEILDARSARLLAGSITGRCEQGGFTLQTPLAEVVDVGTEYGVSVDRASGTKVAVFEGEVHVKSARKEPDQSALVRLTTGMSANIDQRGKVTSGPLAEHLNFRRALPPEAPSNLGAGEVSLVDIICGSAVGEYRIAGAIDPRTGNWGERPWTQPKGVEVRAGNGQFVHVGWNPMIDGVFVPSVDGGAVQVDSRGDSVEIAPCSGTTWGPMSARRRIKADLAPVVAPLGQDDEGFWGSGTVTAMLDRLRWSRDGLVGLHANIGVSIDLDAVRRAHSGSINGLRGVVTLLERSRVSQPFLPKSLADFRVCVDGQERYQRLAFSREDGDAQFGVSIKDSDHFLTLIVTDGGDGNLFDRVILIDPALELSLD